MSARTKAGNQIDALFQHPGFLFEPFGSVGRSVLSLLSGHYPGYRLFGADVLHTRALTTACGAQESTLPLLHVAPHFALPALEGLFPHFSLRS